MKRWRLMLFSGLIHWVAFAALAEINYYLGQFGLAIHLDILLVLFAGLYFRPTQGFIFVLALAGLADAARASPWGLYTLFSLFLWSLVFTLRSRLQSENFAQITVFALVLQLTAFIVMALLLAGPFILAWPYWQRVGVECLLSLTILFLIASPWCAFNRFVLRDFGWDINAELREA